MFYVIVRALAYIFIHLRCKIIVRGADNIPSDGGVIICSNHLSLFDPVVIAVSARRKICFMAKKELFKNPLLKRFFTGVNAFPVDRETSDIQSYKKALSLLKDGLVLGIFVSGTRLKETDTLAAKSGASMFALKTGACIIPAKITGSYKLFSKVIIEFGEAITLNEYAGKKVKRTDIDNLTGVIVKRIDELICE